VLATDRWVLPNLRSEFVIESEVAPSGEDGVDPVEDEIQLQRWSKQMSLSSSRLRSDLGTAWAVGSTSKDLKTHPSWWFPMETATYRKTRQSLNEQANDYKSEGERRIASFLGQLEIPFQYEKPLAVVDKDKTKIWYPDFTLTDYGMVLVEYFGVNGSEDYRRRTLHKMKVYEANGLDVIPVYPQDFKKDWKGQLMSGIYGILERRIEDFFEVLKGGAVEEERRR